MTNTPQHFLCPGETHPVSRSVHLARLAAFYPKCRTCVLRDDGGSLPRRFVDLLEHAATSDENRALVAGDGFRGVHLNELDRRRAGELTQAFARQLWNETLVGRGTNPSGIKTGGESRRRARPSVVVGYDDRPSSPDVFIGAKTALRRSGCEVVDLAQTTGPCLRFAVEHLDAAAGVYVTGSGRGPAWTGLDFYRAHAEPVAAGSGLEAIEHETRGGAARPTRRAGTHRSFQALVPYEAVLWKHFHALRPLKFCCATTVRQTQSTLARLCDALPCELTPVSIPRRVRNLGDPEDADVVRLGRAVRGTAAHLGVLIDDDATRCAFVNEHGDLVPAVQLARMLGRLIVAAHADATIVVNSTIAADAELAASLKKLGVRCITTGRSGADVHRAMREQEAPFGVDGDATSHRWWFGQSAPACDAVLTLAAALSALSHSDAPFSRVSASPV